MGKLYRRKTPQIIRYHYISKEKDEEEYYHRLLLLYLPWKSEQELKCNGGYKEKFEEVKETIIPTIKQYEPYYDEVEHIIDTFDPGEMLPEVWDQVSANIQQDIANKYNVRCMNSHLDPELIEKQPVDHSKKMNSNKTFSLTPTYQMADQDFHKFVQTLNEKQKYLFDFMFNWATKTRLLEDKPPPFYIYLSGSGCVGKSHLVNTIYHGVTRALKTPGQNPDQPTVLLTASTGKAATGINGTTLHSAFALPVKTKASKSSEYQKIGSERLNKMRSSYANLKLIIADEISMFGSQNLQNLHLALQDIFQDYNTPFAGEAI
ncbi:uncharacterized protein LOC132748840 isoform X1 [Ruditapes philippinarum]|uniref:uncharacterized protein LOC132748840 isoform X1 n=1 Tax=Ruditapes philippinarum TaxID=129788 RepID=UPI00295C01BA|nr:uncharacterized protein LOC132748840 isoform X1 [Ruditapes philippinarum]